ncbi:His-Xaa-Ser system radical SAM maturase HxsB [Neorhizobium sp. BT27B]|uniref:His-Xaa-Ser system radical SAM maturase HxsB n=1 Tax=Neorhizobium sp. BT27B TaxID=3142625 RepID=UPI003D28819E
MTVFPLKFRHLDELGVLFADDAGGYFKSDEAFLERYATDDLNESDHSFLRRSGHSFDDASDLDFAAFSYRFAQRLHLPRNLNYVILVPTLRCNLACSYCQVSRVNEGARGYDWDEETLVAVIRWLDTLHTDDIKIEFQGGEPLLRLDVLQRVREFARSRFKTSSFVVCTNLQQVSDEAWEFLGEEDTSTSTSLDATIALHERQRTISADMTSQFLGNLEKAVRSFPDRVSALPTVDPTAPPEPVDVVETFARYGMRSIYLRPVNHQGFARKRFTTKDSASSWNSYHSDFIDALVAHNWTSDHPVEEYYFTHCLRRVLRSGHDGHVDLRNPNIVGESYLVIDYDGTFYPTDEARMITRVGQIDLRLGDVHTGLRTEVLSELNEGALNNFDPDCMHCPYQAFCGVDVIDDLSRYGRIDMPRHITHFCRRHTAIFDKIFEMIYSTDAKVRKSMAIWAGVENFDPSLARTHA